MKPDPDSFDEATPFTDEQFDRLADPAREVRRVGVVPVPVRRLEPEPAPEAPDAD